MTLKNAAGRLTLDVFEVGQLQRAVLVATCLFEGLAVLALWNGVQDRAIAALLVPVAVYAVIGVAIYWIGMKYLRVHYAQLRVRRKDWLVAEQVLAAEDNGVMLQLRFGSVYLVWEKLAGIAHDDSNFYFLFERRQGFLVPKEAVRSPELLIKLDDMANLTRAKSMQER